MKKLFSLFITAFITVGVCIAFVGCGSGTDNKKETIKYDKEYNYTYQDEHKTIIAGTENTPQRTATIITTYSSSYIFFDDGTYNLIEKTKEQEKDRDDSISEKTINGYRTYVILNDNYLYVTQYSYNNEAIPIHLTHRFKIENENTLISDTETAHTYLVI